MTEREHQVSAVVLTYNEEDNIADLIHNLSWCDEIIIVDSQSDDMTRAIAQRLNAEIVDAPAPEPRSPFDHFRQAGVDRARNKWVLVVDADERIPTTLEGTLRRHVRRDKPAEIVEAPRANYFRGRQLRYANFWPAYSVVLFAKGAIEFTKVPHAFVNRLSDRRRKLPVSTRYAVKHYFSDSVIEYWQTQHQYAKIGGNHRHFKYRHLISPIYAFYERFIKFEGYREGYIGLGLSLAWAWYQAETTVRSAINRYR